MNDQEPFTPGTGRKEPYRVRYVGMSDVDYRDEHRKALEHIERLEAHLTVAKRKSKKQAVRIQALERRLAAAERDRDEARAVLQAWLELHSYPHTPMDVFNLADRTRAALATPEGKAEDE